jgi:hypothetical protein
MRRKTSSKKSLGADAVDDGFAGIFGEIFSGETHNILVVQWPWCFSPLSDVEEISRRVLEHG